MDLKLKPSEAINVLAQLHNLTHVELPGNVKYAVYKNIDILTEFTKTFSQTRLDLFKQFGKLQDGSYFIPEFIGDTLDQINPNYTTFKEQVDPLDVADDIKDLRTFPEAIFNGEKTFEGDLRLIYKHFLV